MGTITKERGCIVIEWDSDGYRAVSSENRTETIALLTRLARLGVKSEANATKALEYRALAEQTKMSCLRSYYAKAAKRCEETFVNISMLFTINEI